MAPPLTPPRRLELAFNSGDFSRETSTVRDSWENELEFTEIGRIIIPYLGHNAHKSFLVWLKDRPLSPSFWARSIKYRCNREKYKKAESYNEEKSRLLQLPVELLLVILGYTDIVSKLCTRRVCNRLRACLAIIDRKALQNYENLIQWGAIPPAPGYPLSDTESV